MALINCPNCGHKVSNKANTCPKCGQELSPVVNPQTNSVQAADNESEIKITENKRPKTFFKRI